MSNSKLLETAEMLGAEVDVYQSMTNKIMDIVLDANKLNDANALQNKMREIWNTLNGSLGEISEIVNNYSDEPLIKKFQPETLSEKAA